MTITDSRDSLRHGPDTHADVLVVADARPVLRVKRRKEARADVEAAPREDAVLLLLAVLVRLAVEAVKHLYLVARVVTLALAVLVVVGRDGAGDVTSVLVLREGADLRLQRLAELVGRLRHPLRRPSLHTAAAALVVQARHLRRDARDVYVRQGKEVSSVEADGLAVLRAAEVVHVDGALGSRDADGLLVDYHVLRVLLLARSEQVDNEVGIDVRRAPLSSLAALGGERARDLPLRREHENLVLHSGDGKARDRTSRRLGRVFVSLCHVSPS